jgi:hypothetical protein
VGQGLSRLWLWMTPAASQRVLHCPPMVLQTGVQADERDPCVRASAKRKKEGSSRNGRLHFGCIEKCPALDQGGAAPGRTVQNFFEELTRWKQKGGQQDRSSELEKIFRDFSPVVFMAQVSPLPSRRASPTFDLTQPRFAIYLMSQRRRKGSSPL